MAHIIGCIWLDPMAGNEEAGLCFNTETMTVKYFGTPTHKGLASPAWEYTWDAGSNSFRIPRFRHRAVRDGEFTHDVRGQWSRWHFKLSAPYERVMVVPVGNVLVRPPPSLAPCGRRAMLPHADVASPPPQPAPRVPLVEQHDADMGYHAFPMGPPNSCYKPY